MKRGWKAWLVVINNQTDDFFKWHDGEPLGLNGEMELFGRLPKKEKGCRAGYHESYYKFIRVRVTPLKRKVRK